MYGLGCLLALVCCLKVLLKKFEQADKMTLCACRVLDPESVQARVTSKKSLSVRSSLKAPETFSAKSFHRRQKLSVPDAPILDEITIFWDFLNIPGSFKGVLQNRFTFLTPPFHRKTLN